MSSMASQMPESGGDPTTGTNPPGDVRSRATVVMDQALELAAEEQLSVSSESDEEDVTATQPTTTQRRQLQNAKFNALYVPINN